MDSEHAGPCQRSSAQLPEWGQVECWKKVAVDLEVMGMNRFAALLADMIVKFTF